MSDELFLIIYLFIIIGSQFCGGYQRKPECNVNYSDNTYICQNISGSFPIHNYFRIFGLTCNLNCKFPTFSNETFPYPENQLIYFNVSNTNIKNIEPYAFVNLPELQTLDLSFNKITQIPNHSFDSLSRLNQLSLEHNKITLLQPGYLDSSEITQVNVSFNNIAEILPDTFSGSNLLINLDLQHNKINKLHFKSFKYLATLEYLDLEYNDICHLPVGVFNWLHNLRNLNLGYNSLSIFELGTFSGLGMLETLNLSHNKLKQIDGSILMTLGRLMRLDISSNRMLDFHFITSRMFIPSLKFLSFEDNIFSCDLLKKTVGSLNMFQIDIVTTAGRFNVRNINGIACSLAYPNLKDNFETFLQIVQEESKDLEQQTCE